MFFYFCLSSIGIWHWFCQNLCRFLFKPFIPRGRRRQKLSYAMLALFSPTGVCEAHGEQRLLWLNKPGAGCLITMWKGFLYGGIWMSLLYLEVSDHWSQWAPHSTSPSSASHGATVRMHFLACTDLPWHLQCFSWGLPQAAGISLCSTFESQMPQLTLLKPIIQLTLQTTQFRLCSWLEH